MDFFYKGKRRDNLISAGVFCACIVMVLFPEPSLVSAQKGLVLWAGNVLPALLPFFICVNFLNNMDITGVMPVPVFTFFMSVFSGYPMGAKITGDLCRSGIVGRDYAAWLISFCSTSGPAFIAGAVGTSMLGSGRVGTIMSAVHILAALLNGLLFYVFIRCVKKTKISRRRKTSLGPVRRNNGGIAAALTDSILSSFRSLGIILAYIIIFMFVTDALRNSGILYLAGGDAGGSLIRGFFEMTVGCSFAAGSSMNLVQKAVLCSFIIGFGGLSVIGQSMSMLTGTGIRLRYFVATKLVHGLLAGGLTMAVAATGLM